ncbi:hypothetical protein GFL91_28445 [Rhizobium leguminosarum bv. viciae]|uniref:Uncharacterized protein n=1 Tax=Rhizobium leguminosarum bv. viciae TaxID=387 RepID=A0A8I2GVQ2_RHILV|nr:hypothetical protein [Rhizobium leguminosarum bv. viciae]
MDRQSDAVKANESLPNGAGLTVESRDIDGLSAIIGAFDLAQTGADLRIYLHREPIDFRAAINSLAVLVEEPMAPDAFPPAVFAFCDQRRYRMKLLSRPVRF